MRRSFDIFFNIFLLYLFEIANSTEFVPVLIWATNETPEPIPALHKISEDSFKDSLLELTKKNPYVVVFAERTLSPEDFAQKNQAGEIPFKSFSGLKKKYKVTYEPYVQNPIRAVKHLNEKVTEVSISSLLRNFNVPKDTNILIVDLNDAKDDEHRFDMLRRHETTVMSIYNELLKQHNNHVLAIYTAHHTSWVAPEEVTHRKIRSLLAEGDEPATPKIKPKFLKTPDVYFALHGAIKVNNSEEVGNVTMDDLSIKSEKGNSSSGYEYVIMTLNAPDLEIKTNISAIADSTGYWQVSHMNVTYKTVQFENFTKPNINAPFSFSYHCGQDVFSFEEGKKTVSIPGMQIFPLIFSNANDSGKFPDAYDCVGFTTVPIWSGIFVTMILLLIMTFGLTMMMDIKTMDRFDDAKGKTITISASE